MIYDMIVAYLVNNFSIPIIEVNHNSKNTSSFSSLEDESVPACAMTLQ